MTALCCTVFKAKPQHKPYLCSITLYYFCALYGVDLLFDAHY